MWGTFVRIRRSAGTPRGENATPAADKFQPLHVRFPPGRHEEDIPFDRPRLPFPLRRPHPQQHRPVHHGRLESFRVREDLHPLGFQAAAENQGDVRILGAENLVPVFDDRYVRPESTERLRHLHADRPATQDQQVSRQHRLREDRLVRPVRDVREPFDGRQGGARTGGDDPRPRGQARPVEVDRMVVDKAWGSEPDLRAELAEPLRRVVLLDRADHRTDPAHDGGEGDRRKGHIRKPELLRAARKGPDSGGTDQRLRRDAAEVQAVAPQRLRLFDEDRLRAELRRSRGRRQPRRAPSENPQIVIERRHERLLSVSTHPCVVQDAIPLQRPIHFTLGRFPDAETRVIAMIAGK